MTPAETIKGADDRGAVSLTALAGPIRDLIPADPPPNSWASSGETDVAIWQLSMGTQCGADLPIAEMQHPIERSTRSKGQLLRLVVLKSMQGLACWSEPRKKLS